MLSTYVAIGIGVACLIAGIGIGFLIGRSGRGGPSGKAAAAQAELAEYKARVNDHFEETAKQFENVGRQYREMYETMAASAQSLISDSDADRADNPFLRLSLLADATDDTDEESEKEATEPELIEPDPAPAEADGGEADADEAEANADPAAEKPKD